MSTYELSIVLSCGQVLDLTVESSIAEQQLVLVRKLLRCLLLLLQLLDLLASHGSNLLGLLLLCCKGLLLLLLSDELLLLLKRLLRWLGTSPSVDWCKHDDKQGTLVYYALSI